MGQQINTWTNQYIVDADEGFASLSFLGVGLQSTTYEWLGWF